jgi:hypothetical protein
VRLHGVFVLITTRTGRCFSILFHRAIDGESGLCRRRWGLITCRLIVFGRVTEAFTGSRGTQQGGCLAAAGLANFMPQPATSCDACHKVATRLAPLSPVRYLDSNCSVLTRFGHRKVMVKGYVDRVEIACHAGTIAVHARSYDMTDVIYNPWHYLALLARTAQRLLEAAPPEKVEVCQAQRRTRFLLRFVPERCGWCWITRRVDGQDPCRERCLGSAGTPSRRSRPTERYGPCA